MTTYAAAFLFVTFALVPAFAQQDQTFNGTCPLVTTQLIFNENRYEGTWYEIKKYVNKLVPGECGSQNYTLAKNRANYTVNVISRNLASNTNSTLKLVLKKQVISPTPGRYDVYVNGNTKDRIPDLVLETDYTTYTVEWGCAYNSTSRQSTQRLSVYSRQKTLSSTIFNRIVNLLKRFKIDHLKLRDVVQDDKKCGRKK